MSQIMRFPGIILATLALIIPGLDGQCIDCAKMWNADCKPNETGFYCTRGADVITQELTQAEFETSTKDPHNMYSSCVPYPLHLEYVNDWCCFWSKDVGCQATIHPTHYRYEMPSRYCEECRSRCICRTRTSTKPKMQPWHWSCLAIISVVLARLL